MRLSVTKSKICAVLKADAYGHGIGLLMPSIIATGVPLHGGVASNEEARVVRESDAEGPTDPRAHGSTQRAGSSAYANMEELVGNLDFAVCR